VTDASSGDESAAVGCCRRRPRGPLPPLKQYSPAVMETFTAAIWARTRELPYLPSLHRFSCFLVWDLPKRRNERPIPM